MLQHKCRHRVYPPHLSVIPQIASSTVRMCDQKLIVCDSSR